MTPLTGEEIKQLMEQARKMGAARFKYGDLEVEFGESNGKSERELVDPKTGLTPSEAADWFASSGG